MAFVKIENKVSDIEIIIFPNLYEQVGGKLQQDNVIKVTGRVNATDRNGNPTTEVKVIAESIELISDDELENYKSTGEKIPEPAGGAKRKYSGKSEYKKAIQPEPEKPEPIAIPKNHRNERLYVLLEDPNNADTLNQIRHLCDKNPGLQEIVLVLKEGEDKRPLRLPFRVAVGPELIDPLKELLGEEKVKIQ